MADPALVQEVDALWGKLARSIDEVDRRRLALAPPASLKRPGVLVALALAGAAWLTLLSWPRLRFR